MTRLHELAAEVTSKNAGNFAITLDVVFDESAAYERTRAAGIFTREAIAALYGIPIDEVLHIVEFHQGNAFKIALRRPRSSGDIGETDVYGAQQYAPLLDLEVP